MGKSQPFIGRSCPVTTRWPARSIWIVWTCLAGLSCASCTELTLAPYRNEELLRDHRYALGEKYATVGDLRLCYQERGSGPNILIIPGLCTDIDFWQLTVPVLAQRYHVWVVDPPGQGKSDKPEASYDLLWIRDYIVKFMDQMGIERTSLIGGSMGGQLCLLTAMSHPDRVDKLVLMGSSGEWPPPSPPVKLALWMLWNEDLITDHLRRHWPIIFRKMFLRQTPLTQRIFKYQMALRADPEAYQAEGRASARALRSIFFHSCSGKLSQFDKPTLLIWGDSDQWHLRAEALRFKADLPNGRLVIVPNSGHEVMIDRPRVFNDLVMAFLEDGWSGIDGRETAILSTTRPSSAVD